MGRLGDCAETFWAILGWRWLWFGAIPIHEPVDRQDYQKINYSGNQQKGDQRINNVANYEILASYPNRPGREVWPAAKKADQWGDQVFNHCVNDVAESRADHDADC